MHRYEQGNFWPQNLSYNSFSWAYVSSKRNQATDMLRVTFRLALAKATKLLALRLIIKPISVLF